MNMINMKSHQKEEYETLKLDIFLNQVLEMVIILFVYVKMEKENHFAFID